MHTHQSGCGTLPGSLGYQILVYVKLDWREVTSVSDWNKYTFPRYIATTGKSLKIQALQFVPSFSVLFADI